MPELCVYYFSSNFSPLDNHIYGHFLIHIAILILDSIFPFTDAHDNRGYNVGEKKGYTSMINIYSHSAKSNTYINDETGSVFLLIISN